MTTPATRDEVVELMARAYCESDGLPADDMVTATGNPLWFSYAGDMRAVITALEAAGLVIVPVEATEGQESAALDAHATAEPYASPFGPAGTFQTAYRAMVAASPYNKEPQP
jgi:hypothetical protein